MKVAENKLDTSEKSEKIKSLLFRNCISYEQWNVFRKNSDTSGVIEKYFPYIDRQVMFSCVLVCCVWF